MDFWRTVLVLFKRWYITVPAFFATLAVAAGGASVVPLQYQSVSVLVLTTPLSGGTKVTNPGAQSSLTNPMLNFDRSLALSASLVIQQLRSSEMASSLGITPGGPVSYEISNGSSNPELLETGPFIFVTGTAPTPEAAQEITQKVAVAAAAALDHRQDELNAPPSTHINMQTVIAPTAGQPLTGSPMRAAAAAGALAGMMSLAAVYGFESLMTHRRRRREERERAAASHDEAAATPHGVDDVDHVVDVEDLVGAAGRSHLWANGAAR